MENSGKWASSSNSIPSGRTQKATEPAPGMLKGNMKSAALAVGVRAALERDGLMPTSSQ